MEKAKLFSFRFLLFLFVLVRVALGLLVCFL